MDVVSSTQQEEDVFSHRTKSTTNSLGSNASSDDGSSKNFVLSDTEIYIIIGAVGGVVILFLVLLIFFLVCSRKTCQKGPAAGVNESVNRPPPRFDIVRNAQQTVPDVVVVKQDEDGTSEIGNDLPTLQIRGRPRAQMATDLSYRNSNILNPADLMQSLPYNRLPPELQLGLPIVNNNVGQHQHQKTRSEPVNEYPYDMDIHGHHLINRPPPHVVNYPKNVQGPSYNYLNERIGHTNNSRPRSTMANEGELMVSLV